MTLVILFSFYNTYFSFIYFIRNFERDIFYIFPFLFFSIFFPLYHSEASSANNRIKSKHKNFISLRCKNKKNELKKNFTLDVCESGYFKYFFYSLNIEILKK